MPQVPQYQQRVAVQNLPSARVAQTVDANTLGAQAFAGVAQVGQTLGVIAQKEQEKQDVAALMQADRELADLELKLLHDPEAGAYSLRGQQAEGVQERVFPEWERGTSQIAARLTPAQRAAFERQAQGRRSDVARSLARHQMTEMDRFYAQEAEATVTTAQTLAAANWTDPNRIATEVARAERGAMSLDDGASPIVVQQRVLAARSGVYAAAVEQALAADPASGAALFAQYRAQMSPEDIVRYEPQVREYRRSQEAQAAVDALFPAGGPGSVGDYGRYLVALESGGDPTARAATSSATGLHQFTAGTWLDTVAASSPAWAAGLSEAEILEARTDPAKSAEMEAVLRSQNAAALTRAGQQATNENLYAAHHFGQRGGVAFARAAGDTPIESILSADQIAANPYLAGLTKDEVIANWASRAERAGVAPGAAAPRPSVSLADGLRALEAIPDPATRRIAESNLRARVAAEEAAQREARDAAVSDGFAHIQGGGTLADMPPALRARIDPEGIARIEQYERVRAANGGVIQTDRARLYELIQMAGERPLEFAALDLTADMARLSQADMEQLGRSQAAIKAGRPDELAQQQQLVAAVTGPVLQSVGLMRPVAGAPTRSQPVEGQEERITAFQSAIFDQVQAYRRENGRDPSIEDVQSMTDRLLLRTTVQVPGRFWGTNTEERFAFEMPPQEEQEAITEPPGEPSAREVGKLYTTPRGLARWMGNGWQLVNP